MGEQQPGMQEHGEQGTMMMNLGQMQGEMNQITPHWNAMLDHMKQLVDKEGKDQSPQMMGSMQDLAEHMEAMMKAGNETMGTLQRMTQSQKKGTGAPSESKR
jgi:hypothetical protein